MKNLKSVYRIILILFLIIGSNNNVSGQMQHINFKLAVVQMKVDGGERSRNLERAGERIREAAANGADVLLLPEAMDLGWTDPSSLKEAQPVPGGETSDFLSAMAREYKVYICSGLTEKDGDRVYNAAVIINPDGEIMLKHRKINELDIGHPYYALGERLNVVKTRYGTFGLMICADATARDQVLTRSLAYMGADVILSPSSWAMPAGHDNEKEPYGDTWRNVYIPVARDFRVWIASSSNVGWMTGGPWKGWKGIGSSMVVDPDGKEVLLGPYGVDADTIMYVEIRPETRPGQGTTWGEFWQQNR
ncbi:MAG: carbon-nitrogen hydrolase family protein [Cyclobacteriaceae bacterium]|nr:carbon-nitrogen hydrolase family protein [Cyclobacteriaceae bacterium]